MFSGVFVLASDTVRRMHGGGVIGLRSCMPCVNPARSLQREQVGNRLARSCHGGEDRVPYRRIRTCELAQAAAPPADCCKRSINLTHPWELLLRSCICCPAGGATYVYLRLLSSTELVLCGVGIGPAGGAWPGGSVEGAGALYM